MIPAREMKEKARELGVPESTIERDYAQNWLLRHLSNLGMALKGGTGIRKAYIRDYRFSDDLDFTLLGGMKNESLKTQVVSAVRDAKEKSGITFDEGVVLKENPNGYEIIVYFRILRGAGSPLRMKLDITNPEKEKILLPIQKRNIFHSYSDDFASSVSVYSLEEITAEKIRALFERTRPRDLYDICYLWGKIDKEKVLNILPEKCVIRGVSIDGRLLVDRKSDFGNAWRSSLQHQLQKLPDFDEAFDTVVEMIE